MLTERFEQLWLWLIGRWVAYQDAPRDPSQVRELAGVRAQVDDARSAIRLERQLIREHARVAPLMGSRIAVSEDDLARLRVHVFPQG